MAGKPKLFEPYRALGLFSSGIPHCTRYHQKHQEHYVFLPLGKVFHTYNCSRLGITQISNAHPQDISCIGADRFFVFTGCGKEVRAFEHNRQVKYMYEGHEKDVHIVMPFAKHLISVDKSSMVKIWHIRSQELYLEMEFDNKSFEISAIIHPATYVNKIIFGSSQGTLQLWNIRKNVMLYNFKDSSDTSSVICMTQSPAVDIIAIGRMSGNVIVHNLKMDQEIMRFKQNEGPVTSVAFRTDGPSTMLTAGGGKISVWDLEEKRLLSVMDHVHSEDIAGMTLLPGQPLLLTNSSDNSIKVWAFDQSDGTGRLLRCRAGHSQPPTKIRFHDETNLISAAQDSTLRIFSLEHEEKNKSMGQASLNRAQARRAPVWLDKHKLPPIVDFFSTTARQREWDNIIAFHRKTAVATTWNSYFSRMGSHKLLHERFKSFRAVTHNGDVHDNIGIYVSAVTMTYCGNFCLIGYNTGNVDMFNMQSGIYRGSFSDGDVDTAHTRQVSGISVNHLNQVVVTCGWDNWLKFWRFKTMKLLGKSQLPALLGKVLLPSTPSMLSLQGENSLIATALDDFSIHVYDFDTRNLARHFHGFRSAITDITWSSNGRWLVASSMDCTIRTFELSSSSMIDCFLVDSPAVTVALSHNSNVLATCHVDDLGIYLWYNSAMFGRVSLDPIPLDYHPTDIVQLPGTEVIDSNDDAETHSRVESLGNATQQKEAVVPLGRNLVTLAGLPSTKWAHLTSLDIIKKRNKPRQPVIQPKAAPFFLPTLSGINPTFNVSDETNDTKITQPAILIPLSKFASSLQDLDNKQAAFTALNKLKELGPSAIDIEIRSLAPDLGGSTQLMHKFLTLVLLILESKRDFEFIEALLGLFMKIHADVIAADPPLVELLKSAETEHNECWKNLRKCIDQSICLLNHVKLVKS